MPAHVWRISRAGSRLHYWSGGGELLEIGFDGVGVAFGHDAGEGGFDFFLDFFAGLGGGVEGDVELAGGEDFGGVEGVGGFFLVVEGVLVLVLRRASSDFSIGRWLPGV